MQHRELLLRVEGYRITELASDMFSGTELLCPALAASLIGSVRVHLYGCAMLLVVVRRRVRRLRRWPSVS